MIASVAGRSLLDRMLDAALLEPAVYEEAAEARETRRHAALVVVLASLAAGLGALGAGLTGFVSLAAAAGAGWGLTAVTAYEMATRRFRVRRNAAMFHGLLRALGLASAPRLLLVLTFVPEVGFLVGLAVHAWALITTAYAVKLSLDIEARPAVITAVAAWLPMLLVWALAFALV